MKLALFDLDQTLVPMDTGDAWVRYVVRQSGVEAKPVFDELERFVREYREERIDINDFMHFHLTFLARFQRAYLDVYIDDFVEQWVRPHISQAARQLVQERVQAGDTVVLCTATYSFVTAPIAALLGIPNLLAARPAEDAHGEFTGELDGEHSYREGKVRMVQNFLKIQKMLCARTFDRMDFYSDSINDRPLFDFVSQHNGCCFAVNPDAALEQFSRAHHWSVVSTYTAADIDRAKAQWSTDAHATSQGVQPCLNA